MSKKKPCGLDYCPLEEIIGAYASCTACAWGNDGSNEDKSEEAERSEQMTINGAIMELVMLCEHPMMPNFFKPSIQKVIETISEAELVEPTDTADTPQTNCETCRHYKPTCELFSEICKYEPITQTKA